MKNEIIETYDEIVVVDNKSTMREKIMDFESIIVEHPDAFFIDNDVCTLKHTFSDGIYVREMSIPKGVILTGRIHKHEHPYFIMSGEVEIVTEDKGIECLKSPMSLISPAGTKRVIRAIEDTVLVSVHHNPENIKDIDRLVDRATAENYEELADFIIQKKLDSEGEKKYLNVVGDNNSGVNNCGLTALRNICELKNISARTLIDTAEDNGVKLYPYKVSSGELSNIPLPAIVHSENHFDYISKKEDLKEEVNYSGNILALKKSELEAIPVNDLSGITGSTMMVTGIVSGAVALTGTIITASSKSSQAKKQIIAERKKLLTQEAVKARQKQEEEKMRVIDRNNKIIVGASIALLATGVLLFFTIINRQQKQ